ncbi:MAG: SDR family NAD(P)-dependent oxidoreductase [Candidatus Marinimicrobia bacterium]|nr:SDR family NAD(P)-dependent oxidoreductase [Candidatus Neomarinimicrobiota bacterium]
MKKIIIIGCTSGIGLELSRQYMQRGELIGGCGRNKEKLSELKKEFPEHFFPEILDISLSENIAPALENLIDKIGGLDLLIISSSISVNNPELKNNIEEELIHINVRGYTLVINEAIRYFKKQGKGHLAGITSIAQFIASKSPGYSASKSWEAKYLEGMRLKTFGKNILISEIIPGFVKTPLIANRKNMFWITPVEKAARQIISGLDNKKLTMYISKRWRYVRWLLAIVPPSLLRNILSSKDNRN